MWCLNCPLPSYSASASSCGCCGSPSPHPDLSPSPDCFAQVSMSNYGLSLGFSLCMNYSKTSGFSSILEKSSKEPPRSPQQRKAPRSILPQTSQNSSYLYLEECTDHLGGPVHWWNVSEKCSAVIFKSNTTRKTHEHWWMHAKTSTQSSNFRF